MSTDKQTTRVPPTRNKSWQPGQKGQGGEGMSEGYGGSAGPGTGPSGPDTDRPSGETVDHKRRNPRALDTLAFEIPSASLPSPERIAEVLR